MSRRTLLSQWVRRWYFWQKSTGLISSRATKIRTFTGTQSSVWLRYTWDSSRVNGKDSWLWTRAWPTSCLISWKPVTTRLSWKPSVARQVTSWINFTILWGGSSTLKLYWTQETSRITSWPSMRPSHHTKTHLMLWMLMWWISLRPNH